MSLVVLHAMMCYCAEVGILNLKYYVANICYDFFMFTFYLENKFLIGQTRKL